MLVTDAPVVGRNAFSDHRRHVVGRDAFSDHRRHIASVAFLADLLRCGAYRGLCIEHGAEPGETKTHFKTRCNNMWQRVKIAAGDKARRSRTISWQTLQDEIAAKYPGASRADLRHLVLTRVKTYVVRMSAEILSDGYMKEAAKALSARYRAQVEAISADILKCASARGWTLSQDESQFLTHLTPTVMWPFLCRYRDCLFVTMNHLWVQHRHHHWFSCPRCGRKYAPGKSSGGRVPAARALCMQQPGGSYFTTLCTWPASEEDGWLAGLCEAHARRTVIGEPIGSFLEKTHVGLDTLLSSYRRPTLFQQFAWDPSRHWNKLDPAQWDFERLLQGFPGCHLSPEQADLPVFDDWELLVPLLGNIVAGGLALTSKM